MRATLRMAFERAPLFTTGLGLALLAAGASVLLSRMASDNTHFAIRANTQVVRVDLPCGDKLVWDLPPGRIGDPDADEVAMPRRIAVTMRGGSSAIIRLSSQRQLDIVWPADAGYACATDGHGEPDGIVVDTDSGQASFPNGALAYLSEEPLGSQSSPLLLLRGRVRLGDEIVEGAGFSGMVHLPILLSGTVEARTPDTSGQKRLIHAEDVEAGSQIDTHACLAHSEAATALQPCLAGRRTGAALGFVHLPPDGDALEAQVSMVGREVGIRPHGGSERQMMVTAWSRWLTSSWLQILVVLTIALGSLANLAGITVKDIAARIVSRRRREPPALVDAEQGNEHE